MNKGFKYRFLFAGGGTGGHLYPAIAIAQAIKEMKPESEILFIGSSDKIESKVVPQNGFAFKSITVKGFNRQDKLKNLLFPIYLIISMIQSLAITMKFKPNVSIGTGGYVSGPAIWAASVMGSKIILVEPNSYPGITTRLLERFADEIHICFELTKKYLRRNDIIKITGNPIRNTFKLIDKKSAIKKFNLLDEHKTLLIIGGSLGAKSINNAIKKIYNDLLENNIQIIWQVGKNYYDELKVLENSKCRIFPFIENIEDAFSACDLVVSRAGASSISEISLLGIPSILVPSPNVAENHQYYNSKELADQNAAILIEDKNLELELKEKIIKTINDDFLLSQLKENIRKFAKPDASILIAKSAINYSEQV